MRAVRCVNRWPSMLVLPLSRGGRALATSSASSVQSPPSQLAADRKMGAWQVHAYGDDVQFSDRVHIPVIRDSNDVLVRVLAASLNAIDLEMARGFGATTFNLMRGCSADSRKIEFPLTLGRDFVGVVEHRGMGVREGLRVGDRVWGTVPFQRAGSHAEYTLVDACSIVAAPAGATDIHAAATLYAGLTAWSGLYLSGQLGGLAGATTSRGGGRGKRVCILGASGGVGHLAAQICRAEGVSVVATCSADARELVENAGVEQVIDYRAAEAEQQLAAGGPYDIVLDCAGKGGDYAAAIPWTYGQYVTFTSPVLANNDEFGVIGGSVRNALQLLEANWRSAGAKRGLVKWAYVAAVCPPAIDYLGRLVQQGQLTPVIEKTFAFAEAAAAYQRLSEGHLRGKIVLHMQ